MKPKILEISAIDMTIYKFVVPLMKKLENEGFHIICATSNMGATSKIQNQGFKVYSVDIERRIHPISNLKSIYQLYKIMKQEKVDIVHVHTPIAAVLGRIAAKLAGVKHIVYTIHGFYVTHPVFYHIEKFMGKYCTDYMFTVSNEDLEFAIKEKFIFSDRIRSINSVGIDTKKFNPKTIDSQKMNTIRKSIGIKDDDIVIGFVGRVVKEKGILDLFKVFINMNHPHAKLLIVGSWEFGERDDKTKNQLDEWIHQYHMKDRVIFTGHREDIKELLSIMDVFVLPSYREGMPVSLLEAMAMEKCVVATNIRGCREEVDHKTGKLYEPGNIKELTEILKYFIEHEDERKLLGCNARKRVIELFDQQKVIDKQVNIFKRFK